MQSSIYILDHHPTITNASISHKYINHIYSVIYQVRLLLLLPLLRMYADTAGGGGDDTQPDQNTFRAKVSNSNFSKKNKRQKMTRLWLPPCSLPRNKRGCRGRRVHCHGRQNVIRGARGGSECSWWWWWKQSENGFAMKRILRGGVCCQDSWGHDGFFPSIFP